MWHPWLCGRTWQTCRCSIGVCFALCASILPCVRTLKLQAESCKMPSAPNLGCSLDSCAVHMSAALHRCAGMALLNRLCCDQHTAHPSVLSHEATVGWCQIMDVHVPVMSLALLQDKVRRGAPAGWSLELVHFSMGTHGSRMSNMQVRR